MDRSGHRLRQSPDPLLANPKQGTIKCYGLTGSAADTQYNVLALPLFPGPFIMFFAGNQSQSAVVTTSFPAGLYVAVSNASGGNVAGIPVLFTAPATGASGTFAGGASSVVAVTDVSGIAAAPRLTANSTAGSYAVIASVLAYPRLASPLNFSLTNLPLTSVTLQTSPAGLPVSLGGSPSAAAPQSVSLVRGTSEAIAALSPVAGGAGTQYIWQSWSDSGAISHTITVPSSDVTYTATYKTQYQLTASATPVAEGTASTAGNATFFDSGSSAGVSATPNSGFRFNFWTGSVANTQSASTTVNMAGPTTVTAHFARACNLLGGASVTASDVLQILGQALGQSPTQPDMNSDGALNVLDIQIVVNAGGGLGCLSN